LQISFEGQVVLITGATRGIGAALADAFEESGASLLLTGTDAAQCDELNRAAERAGKSRVYMDVDFMDHDGLSRFLDEIQRTVRIDACVNNAGINRLNYIENIAEEDLQAMLDVDLRAPILITQAVAAVMGPAGYGRIVNVGSIWNTVSKPSRMLYSAMKAGVHGLTIGSAVELAAKGILVNTVSPGFVMTDLTSQNNTDAQIEELAGQVPVGRFAQPAEIANVVLFLASSSNSYVTGQNIVVDGGFTHV
jgi:NAD(P)-dependent dehydrogenase (short-subunit alcohol dehydrogenase family)